MADLLPHTQTRFAEKIARLRSGNGRTGDFMLADAKDADLAGGILSMGPRRDAGGRIIGNRTLPEFRAQLRELVAQDVLDIMLTSTSNTEYLADQGAFEGSRMLPAFRGNEATDAWVNLRGGRYRETPALPYRGADLGLARAPICLYSITFVNDAARDAATLEAYAAFRQEASAHGIRHFLEVFNPNVDARVGAMQGAFVNDCIVRTIASLTRVERPEFLKVAYNGRAALEELVAHDPAMVVGVLGGGGGTHRDTFELLEQAERCGARLALFGRKINMAEHQASLIVWMRRVVDREVSPADAVRGYHADLARIGYAPDRDLETDLEISENILKQGG
ncbi:MAG TPA: hypothetical protein VGC40_08075 [Paenirhodobacter sp.]